MQMELSHVITGSAVNRVRFCHSRHRSMLIERMRGGQLLENKGMENGSILTAAFSKHV